MASHNNCAKTTTNATNATPDKKVTTASEADRLRVLDLGHRLGCLWALCDDLDQSEALLQRVRDLLQSEFANEREGG
eukprot:CAMPEP_0185773740 /NCGR_PEP_ID=MMETSP1174-20130828/74898_1 /TAXON_ID=35687 /ORGANISM="Dictyocha speculum, Strain CCMP1381" /LENGTH=76 /DNA_ID=CAMNT_0028460549 /DNA_START=50 /DNA_END=277 /DNA_ORIENTATION=+